MRFQTKRKRSDMTFVLWPPWYRKTAVVTDKGDQFGIMRKILGFRNRTVKAAVCILLASMSLMLFGYSVVMHAVDREVFGPSAVNDFIDLTDKDLDEITELVCDPGEDACISGSNYDKLGKLENLESVTFVGIDSETDAQNIIEELTGLAEIPAFVLLIIILTCR